MFALNPGMQHEFLINCYSAIDHILAGRSICASKLDDVQSKIQHHLTILVRNHTSKLMTESGMADVVERMRWFITLPWNWKIKRYLFMQQSYKVKSCSHLYFMIFVLMAKPKQGIITIANVNTARQDLCIIVNCPPFSLNNLKLSKQLEKLEKPVPRCLEGQKWQVPKF